MLIMVQQCLRSGHGNAHESPFYFPVVTPFPTPCTPRRPTNLPTSSHRSFVLFMLREQYTHAARTGIGSKLHVRERDDQYGQGMINSFPGRAIITDLYARR